MKSAFDPSAQGVASYFFLEQFHDRDDKADPHLNRQRSAPRRFGPALRRGSAACFAMGTLVHTKEGPKPIEQIQVGDWVLSKPESGREQVYKRVVKNLAHLPQRLVQVEYILPGYVLEDLDRNNLPVPRAHVVATLGHSFWTRQEG